ncbi:hypothetical protein RB195_005670 [Necator americanus]|uniref:Secreted protein n=1 Tax=Necator americanus TaxID=51031 RepID=A0ABR1BP09_NECAM
MCRKLVRVRVLLGGFDTSCVTHTNAVGTYKSSFPRIVPFSFVGKCLRTVSSLCIYRLTNRFSMEKCPVSASCLRRTV